MKSFVTSAMMIFGLGMVSSTGGNGWWAFCGFLLFMFGADTRYKRELQ
jgi:hypothetical protein